MANWNKIQVFIPWPTKEGWEKVGNWWKRWWHIIVIALLAIAIALLSIFLPGEDRVRTVTEVKTVTKTVTQKVEVPVEIIKEIPVEIVKEIESPELIAEISQLKDKLSENTPPELKDNLMHATADEAAGVLRAVFPNVAKGTIEKSSYAIVSEEDLKVFFEYIEGISTAPENRSDFLNWLGGKVEEWNQEVANGIVDPTAAKSNDSFAIFLAFNKAGKIGVVAYNPSGALGGGNYWSVIYYPEAKMYLELY
jgi:LPS O-antigen subunit length determinant protein (WzzB/FepE family)